MNLVVKTPLRLRILYAVAVSLCAAGALGLATLVILSDELDGAAVWFPIAFLFACGFFAVKMLRHMAFRITVSEGKVSLRKSFFKKPLTLDLPAITVARQRAGETLDEARVERDLHLRTQRTNQNQNVSGTAHYSNQQLSHDRSHRKPKYHILAGGKLVCGLSSGCTNFEEFLDYLAENKVKFE